jgi:hypothetical protein
MRKAKVSFNLQNVKPFGLYTEWVLMRLGTMSRIMLHEDTCRCLKG